MASNMDYDQSDDWSRVTLTPTLVSCVFIVSLFLPIPLADTLLGNTPRASRPFSVASANKPACRGAMSSYEVVVQVVSEYAHALALVNSHIQNMEKNHLLR